jgi:Uma2 family endonuclease
MAVLKRDADYHTYADYLVWSRTYGDELVNGTAYVREPPSPSQPHQGFIVELSYQIRGALEGRPCRVFVAPFDVRLPKCTEEDDQVDTVVQPDVFIVSDLQKVDMRGVRGAPDWLVEVLSPSTARYDQLVKLPVYERAGVREVWFIHPTDRTLVIYQLEGGGYGQPTLLGLKGKTPIMAVPGVTIDWDLALANI